MPRHLILLSLTLLLVACDRPTGAAPSVPPTGVVDSALPREELLARFRRDLPEVRTFSGGASSRAELGQLVIRALEARDTARLHDLLVTRAEFAWLYYPTSAQGLPPYDLSPGLYWFMLEQRSAKGLRWLLDERGGLPLRYAGVECGTGANREGENVTWGPCLVHRVQATGDTIAERYFSLVVERGGRFKVLAYSGGQD